MSVKINPAVYSSLSQSERRLVDWQYNRSGHFFTALFCLLCKADVDNFARLEIAFPDEAAAIRKFKTDPDFWPELEKRLEEGESR